MSQPDCYWTVDKHNLLFDFVFLIPAKKMMEINSYINHTSFIKLFTRKTNKEQESDTGFALTISEYSQ